MSLLYYTNNGGLIKMTKKQEGIISVITSAIIFGAMPLVAKMVYEENGNSLTLTFIRFLLSIPLLYLIIKIKGGIDLKITKLEFYKISLLSILGYSATAILLFTSYSYISAGMATTVHFIYPVLVVVACMVIYKDKPNIIKIISVILCIVGILMFYNNEGLLNIHGIIIAFSSGITYAFYILYLEKSILKDMNTLKLTFFLCTISSVVLFLLCITTGNLVLNMTLKGWLLTIILSVSITLGGVCLFQNGIKIIGSQSSSILSTFEPITSILLGLLILNETLTFKTVLGIIFILVASLLVAVFENNQV